MRIKITISVFSLFACCLLTWGQTTVNLSNLEEDGEGYTVKSDTYDPDLTILTFTKTGEYILRQDNKNKAEACKIVIDKQIEGISLTLDNINVSSVAPFTISEKSNLTLILKGENKISSDIDGIQNAGVITIKGDGTLYLKAASTGIVNWSANEFIVESGTINIQSVLSAVSGSQTNNKLIVKGGQINMYTTQMDRETISSNFVKVEGSIIQWTYKGVSETQDTEITLKKGNEIINVFTVPAGYENFACNVEPNQTYTLWKGNIQMKNRMDETEFSVPENTCYIYEKINTVQPTAQMTLDATQAKEFIFGMLSEITTSIALTGEWNSEKFKALKLAIHPERDQKAANTVLKNVDMSKATITNDQGVFISELFINCTELTEVILPESETTSETVLSSTFAGCTKLTKITNLDKLSNIYSLLNTFQNCESLTELTFAPHNTSSKGTDMGNAFNGCKKLVKINNLNSFNIISSLSSTFKNCESLKEAIFSETLQNAESGGKKLSFSLKEAFSGCVNLHTVRNLNHIVNFNSLEKAFYNCKQLSSIVLGALPEKEENLVGIFDECNPYCVKHIPFVPGNATNWKNVIIEGQTETLELQDEYSFGSQIEFEAGQATYTRTLPLDGKWETICIPFDVKKITDEEGNEITGLKLKVYADGIDKKDNSYHSAFFKDAEISKQGVLLEANIPYLISFTSNTSSEKNATLIFTSQGSASFQADADLSVKEGSYFFSGTYVPKNIQDFEGKSFYILEGEGENIKFVKAADSVLLTPFRSYMKAADAEITSPEINISWEPLGIEQLALNENIKIIIGNGTLNIMSDKAQNINIWGIDGKLIKTVKLQKGINQITDLLQGIYIINNQKIVIK